jgi:hypothetical protein
METAVVSETVPESLIKFQPFMETISLNKLHRQHLQKTNCMPSMLCEKVLPLGRVTIDGFWFVYQIY